MLNFSYAGYLDLSPAISAQFIFEMCYAAQNRKKIQQTPYLWAYGHGRSRSSTLVPPKRSSAWFCLIYLQLLSR